MTPPVVAVVGPTAVGKSDLAVELALRLGGDVVNADSMQLYRGMDIGTAKLAPTERRGVPHHLLDVWEVTHPAAVAEYQALARRTFAELAARDRPAVLVGGSGLYVRAALDDLEFPGTDPDVRNALEQDLARHGVTEMYDRLRRLAPEAAVGIEPANARRIVRALEVVELTGAFRSVLPEPAYAVPAVQIGLRAPRPELDDRIAQRVDRMWDSGLVEEVRHLQQVGLRQGRTASRALGYASVLRLLDGELSEEEARAETDRLTRRFARRQESWFGRDRRVTWLAYDSPRLVEEALELATP